MSDQSTDDRSVRRSLLLRRTPLLVLLVAAWVLGALRAFIMAFIILAGSSGPAQDLEALQKQAIPTAPESMSHPGWLTSGPRPDSLAPLDGDPKQVQKEVEETFRLHDELFQSDYRVKQELQRRKFEHDRPWAYGFIALGLGVTALCAFGFYRVLTAKSPLIP